MDRPPARRSTIPCSQFYEPATDCFTIAGSNYNTRKNEHYRSCTAITPGLSLCQKLIDVDLNIDLTISRYPIERQILKVSKSIKKPEKESDISQLLVFKSKNPILPTGRQNKRVTVF